MNEGKKRPGFMLYNHSANVLANLPTSDAGELIQAICRFELEGTLPNLTNPALSAIFQGIKADLEEDERRYKAKCEQNSRNARMRTQADATEG